MSTNALVKQETQLVKVPDAEAIERALVMGDLSKLTPEQRLSYYRQVCESVGLNPLTRPLEYVTLQGKLTLYARREATDQLRALHEVSVERLEKMKDADLGIYVVTAHVKKPNGRLDTGTGAVSIQGMKGDALANAIMKAETKAKRRATLSICGLGLLDESELESVPNSVFTPSQEQIDEATAHYEAQVEARQQEVKEAIEAGAVNVTGEVDAVYPVTNDKFWFDSCGFKFVAAKPSIVNQLLPLQPKWTFDADCLKLPEQVKGCDAYEVVLLNKIKPPKAAKANGGKA